MLAAADAMDLPHNLLLQEPSTYPAEEEAFGRHIDYGVTSHTLEVVHRERGPLVLLSFVLRSFVLLSFVLLSFVLLSFVLRSRGRSAAATAAPTSTVRALARLPPLTSCLRMRTRSICALRALTCSPTAPAAHRTRGGSVTAAAACAGRALNGKRLYRGR